MPFCPIDSASTENVIDFDDRHFRQVVFDFIERIREEIAFYDDYESNISANDFKHNELQIHAQRVEKVLDLCIAKIRRVFYLSYLIREQSDLLKLLFSDELAQEIEQFDKKWFNTMVDASNNEFVSDLNKYLDFLEKHEMTMEWQQVSQSGQSVIRLLNELRQMARYHIQLSASIEMARQKILHQLWAENNKNMRRIQQFRCEIEEDQLKISDITTVKQEEIERYTFDKRRLIHKNSMVINRLIIDSNKAMTEICEIGKCHQNAATQSVLRAKDMFDTLRKNDMCEENEAIQKKIDLEHQLKDFIDVYDHEIGARSLKLHELKKVLKQNSNILDDWKERYKTQEILYKKIVADKEAEEEKRREERILLFMMNRVARIIQRNFRRFLAQQKAKKKGKGKKGGKGKK